VWTLIARFSNSDSNHWIADASFWYDRTAQYGDVGNPHDNMDMISPTFWEKKGSEIKITRSDDASNTALLQTTSNCLQGRLELAIRSFLWVVFNKGFIDIMAYIDIENRSIMIKVV
jgi:hypothetical protein